MQMKFVSVVAALAVAVAAQDSQSSDNVLGIPQSLLDLATKNFEEYQSAIDKEFESGLPTWVKTDEINEIVSSLTAQLPSGTTLPAELTSLLDSITGTPTGTSTATDTDDDNDDDDTSSTTTQKTTATNEDGTKETSTTTDVVEKPNSNDNDTDDNNDNNDDNNDDDEGAASSFGASMAAGVVGLLGLGALVAM